MGMFETNFATLDWCIVAVYLAAIVAIGVVVNRYIHNVPGYMVAGRGSGTALNSATYIATGLGLVTVMYMAMDAFRNGFSFLMLGVIGVAIALVLGSTGLVISRLRELRLITIPEFFERRYGKRVRVAAGLLCAAMGILNMGLFPKMGATFITYATGLGRTERLAPAEDQPPKPAEEKAKEETTSRQQITVNIVTSLMIVLVLLYTVMGGMVSVIITDYLQFVILALGLAIGLLFCLSHPDVGWNRMVGDLLVYRGERAFNTFHPDSYGWVWVLWMLVHVFLCAFCWAPEATRALTARSARTSRLTYLLGAPGQFIRVAIPSLFAIAAFSFVTRHADLAAYFFPDGLGGDPAHGDQAMPLIIAKLVPSGLLGLLVAGMMAAFMSTHDSYFLCWSSIIVRDVVAPLKGRPLTDKEQIRLARILIVIIGAFLLWWGIWYEMPESVWDYMAITGTVYVAGAAPALLGGLYWRRASRVGAMAALLCGLVAIVGIYHQPIQAHLPWLTKPLLGLGTYLFCPIVFVVFSLLFPDRDRVAKEA